MKKGITALAAYRFTRAQQAFQEGAVLAGRGSLYGAANRFYSAACYAARALLATRGLDSSKHSGVIALFQQHFVKTGLMDPGIAKFLSRSFEKRLETGYEDFVSVSSATVDEVQRQVRAFLNACQACFKAVSHE